VFDITVTYVSDDKMMNMSIETKGTFTFRIADCWPTALSLEGPINILPPKGGKGLVTGTGTMKTVTTSTYD